MDPIKVDFAAQNNKQKERKQVNVPVKSKKHTLIAIICALIAGAAGYYFMLPALNFKDIKLYELFGLMLAVYVVLQFLLSGTARNPEEYSTYFRKKTKVPVIIAGVVLLFLAVGFLISSVFFRAGSYSKIITVDENKTFVSDIQEVDFTAVPVLDDASASTLAKKTLGDLSSIGKISQFEVAPAFTQINYKNEPVRVTTLQYGDVFKWLKNTSTGLPGYIVVNMVTQKANLVMFEEGHYMRYSVYEHFGKYLMRHLRFNYPTMLFGEPKFEIDEEGKPYWICPILDKTIGIFGGTDVIGAVLVDSITGECSVYTTDDVKTNASLQWIDGVYSSSLLVEQYNYYGKYSGGFWNSIITQTGVKTATEGYNYLAIDDDVYMYTGVTSAGSDEAIIGFVLVNMRTKDANFYRVSGAKEYSAANSAQGAVQNYEYTATFPILLNISGQPTYFMSLKDASSLVKMYAMVNVEQYQVVVTGSTISECTEHYIAKLKENGINIKVDIDSIEDFPADDETEEPETETFTFKGRIEDIRSAVIDGNTVYYIKIENEKPYFAVKAAENEKAVILNKGDKVTLITHTETGDIIQAEIK